MTQSNQNNQITNPFKKFLSNNWKLLCFMLVVLFSILVTVNAFGFSTTWAYADVLTPEPIKDLVKYTQAVNDILVLFSLWIMLLVVINIGLGSHNRKRYYWTNYLFLSLLIVSVITLGIYMMYQASALRPWFEYLFANYDTEWRIRLFRSIHRIDPPELGYTYIYQSLADTSIYGILSIVSGVLTGIIVLVSGLEHPQLVAREKYIEKRLEMIEKGEILVKDKVVNIVPSVDFEINVEKIDESTQQEKHEIRKVEQMRYQNNGLGYLFMMVSLIAFIIALFSSITFNSYLYQETNDYPKVLTDANLALDIAISIIVLLVGFLSAEKIKYYSKQYPYVIFVLAVINVIRIFTIPMSSLNSGNITIEYFLTAILLPQLISIGLMIAAGVISLIKSTKLHDYLKTVGDK